MIGGYSYYYIITKCDHLNDNMWNTGKNDHLKVLISS